MRRDTVFYGKESQFYSSKRYPDKNTDYVHFFFNKRRTILLKILSGISRSIPNPLSLLEVGCADGVILGSIRQTLPSFARLIGIDISPEMIGKAKGQYDDIEFSVRDKDLYGQFDVVLEIGVLNLVDLQEEFTFAKNNMKPGGYYICSLAVPTSLRNKWVPINGGFKHHLTFAQYEAEIEKHFKIKESQAYGFFIPMIWRVPFLARIVQPLVESIFQNITPPLFHEKIYVLQQIDG